MDTKQRYILHDKNLIKGITMLSIPVILSNILKSLHDVVDMYFVSKINMPAEIVDAQTAAITVTSPIISLFLAFAMGLMIAGGAIISQYIGANKTDKARLASGQLLVCCFIVGVICNIGLYASAPLIMRLMNAEGLIFDYSVTYLRYRSFELIGLFIFYAYQATRQASGDTLSPVIINSSGIVLNVILTGIFINFLGMDLRGAAIGTVISNMIFIPVCLFLLFRNNDLNYRLTSDVLKLNPKMIRKLLYLGVPSALAQGLTSVGFMVVNTFSMRFDPAIISAIGASNRINSLLLYPSMSVGGVLSTFVGQNIGANNPNRARKSLHAALIISLIIAVVGLCFFIPLRTEIVGLLISKNELSITTARRYSLWIFLTLPLMSVFQCFNSCFQGTGRTDT